MQEFCLLALSQPRPQASEDGGSIMARRSLSPRLQVSSRSPLGSAHQNIHSNCDAMDITTSWRC